MLITKLLLCQFFEDLESKFQSILLCRSITAVDHWSVAESLVCRKRVHPVPPPPVTPAALPRYFIQTGDPSAGWSDPPGFILDKKLCIVAIFYPELCSLSQRLCCNRSVLNVFVAIREDDDIIRSAYLALDSIFLL